MNKIEEYTFEVTAGSNGNPNGVLVKHTPTGLQEFCDTYKYSDTNKAVAYEKLSEAVAFHQTDMFVFEFSFPGLALGGTAVVVADTAQNAEAILKSVYPFVTNPKLKRSEPLLRNSVAYFWNGDY